MMAPLSFVGGAKAWVTGVGVGVGGGVGAEGGVGVGVTPTTGPPPFAGGIASDGLAVAIAPIGILVGRFAGAYQT